MFKPISLIMSVLMWFLLYRLLPKAGLTEHLIAVSVSLAFMASFASDIMARLAQGCSDDDSCDCCFGLLIILILNAIHSLALSAVVFWLAGSAFAIDHGFALSFATVFFGSIAHRWAVAFVALARNI